MKVTVTEHVLTCSERQCYMAAGVIYLDRAKAYERKAGHETRFTGHRVEITEREGTR